MTQTDTSRSQAGVPTSAVSTAGVGRPLCVDLDGTLVATDTVWEMILRLLRHRPWLAWRLMAEAWGGMASLKCWLAGEVRLDPAGLPYREEVVAFLRQQRQAGRSLILATGTEAGFARQVAEHLGLFDAVVATEGGNNCTSEGKCRAIAELLGEGVAFDYVGDSRADLAVWARAERAYLVNPSPGVRRRVEAAGRVERVFAEGGGGGGGGGGGRVGALLRGMRPHQWVKSALLALPLLAGHQFFDPVKWGLLLLAMVCFSLASSAVYLINDLFDLAADRQHPLKRFRPLAAGWLPIPWALAAVPVLLGLGLGVAALVLPTAFAGLVAGYVVLALAYSWFVKGKAILDVLWLAGLYTFRLIAGGVAVAVLPSAWLLGFAMFGFLSIAFAKRYAELVRIEQQHGTAAAGRGYLVADLNLIGTVGPVAGYMAVLVFALYITSDDVGRLYPREEALWLVCPLLVYWLTRLWLKAHRQVLREDPVMFALTDPVTYGMVGAITAVASVAKWF